MITKMITWLDTWSRKLPQPQPSDPDQPMASQPQIPVTAQTAMPPLAQLKVTKVETPAIVTLSQATVPFSIANPWVNLPAVTEQNNPSVEQPAQPVESLISDASAIQDRSPSSCETPNPELEIAESEIPEIPEFPSKPEPAVSGSISELPILQHARSLTPEMQDTQPAIAELEIPEVLEIPEIPEILTASKPQPLLDRAALVIALLDEAYSQGIEGYATLIAYVKQQSGTGCSRRTIADWKKLRGLIQEQPSGEQAA